MAEKWSPYDRPTARGSRDTSGSRVMGTLLGYMGQLERLSDFSQKIYTKPTVINTQVNKYYIILNIHYEFELLNYGSTIKSYFHAFSTIVKGKNVRRKMYKYWVFSTH